MSRILSYRVWDNEKKEYSDNTFSLDQYGLLYIQDEDGYWEEANEDRFIIEFNTGLEDKNGKMVYEGNIVEGTMGIFEVKWYDEISRFSFVPNTDMEWHPPFVCDQLKEMEVIGNTHENKELLGGKE